MHPSAMSNGLRFVEKYLSRMPEIRVLDVGSYDVNGSLKPCFEKSGWDYVGLDYKGTPQENVNYFIMPDGGFPFENDSFDVIVSSSCLEHDLAFWNTFAEMIRVSRDGALIYLNVPSEGPYHPHPVDCWRFQKDAFKALSSAFPQVELLESYITPEEQWRDNVGIFRVSCSDAYLENEYGEEFYDKIHEGSLRSAEIVIPLLFKWIQPERVIDAGCGSGAWLSVIRSLGADNVLGLDGSWAEKIYKLEPHTFIPADLNLPLPVDGPFDLALSLEVAEHLPSGRAESFIAELVRLSNVILFSAAVPSQGGVRHLNEQWPEYWAGLFDSHGYRALDIIRPEIWDNDQVEWWYRQNILVFCRGNEIPALFPGIEYSDSSMLSRVHEDGQAGDRSQHCSTGRRAPENDMCFEDRAGSNPAINRYSPYRNESGFYGGTFESGNDGFKQQLLSERFHLEKRLKAELLEAEASLAGMRRLLRTERRHKQNLLNSSSWRLTYPIRWFKDTILGLFGRK